MSDATLATPGFLTWVNQACYSCFKEKSEATLQRCRQCRRVSYCSVDCQRKHWATHKSFCKVLKAVEDDSVYRRSVVSSLLVEPTTTISLLNGLSESLATLKRAHCLIRLGRTPVSQEWSLFGWEPRCLACARSDQDIRIEDAENKSPSNRTLRRCPDCKLSYFCCPSHRNYSYHLHTEVPCKSVHGNLSQCAINQQIRHDVRFPEIMAGSNDIGGPFAWVPDRVKESWTSLENQTWTGEYEAGLGASLGGPKEKVMAYLRGGSDAMSFALTTLWALEKLSDGESWTRKEKLTVHVLGATKEEVTRFRVFEEILHRVPEVKTLRVVMCGPELIETDNDLNKVIDCGLCSQCRSGGRKLIQFFVESLLTTAYPHSTYHDFVQNRGARFIVPDVAMAFNSGVGRLTSEDSAAWYQTARLLVGKKIPSLFTSYNSTEAKTDAALLRSAGAQLAPGLGPTLNPWGSQFSRQEPNKVQGYYGCSRWIAGGFR